VHALGVFGAVLAVELQRREPVLAVDDQVAALRALEIPHALVLAQRREGEALGREERDRPGDGRLADRGLVEVLDRLDLAGGELALERAVGPLDAGDEGGHLVALLHPCAGMDSPPPRRSG
jgi:hypothetical protein